MDRNTQERSKEFLLSRLEDKPEGVMSFLGDDGQWREDPSTRRERISCELCHRLSRITGMEERSAVLADLSLPAGMAAGRVDGPLWYLMLLVGLVEIEACRLLGSRLTREWDVRGRDRRDFFWQGYLTARERLERDFGIPGGGEMPAAVCSQPFYGCLVDLVSAEEEAWYQIDQVLPGLRLPREMEEHVGYLQETLADERRQESLVRPALFLLSHPDIPVASGVPYQAAHLLGKLKDPRATRALMNKIESTGPQHGELRACLIYALGATARPEAAGVLMRFLVKGAGKEGSRELLEAVWALGKLGKQATNSIPNLCALVDDPRKEMRVALAWALGNIGAPVAGGTEASEGRAEKMLHRALVDPDLAVRQEAVLALRSWGRPADLRYTDAVYTEIPYLSLKPSASGIYELSETLFDLLDQKETVVMAVTGDSGTGKTYFCQALEGGFGNLAQNQIRYLARDNPEHNDIFNRMLGLDFLRKKVAPQFYYNYPEMEKDDPDAFFKDFWAGLNGIRLVLLDGWRDDAYFQHVLERFLRQDRLDLLVTFQASHSTRRINLEEREGYLEHVRSCLSYREDPGLTTVFHLEGRIFCYRLNNSIGSRLDRSETLEVFGRRKISEWAAQLRPGQFMQGLRSAAACTRRNPWGQRETKTYLVSSPVFHSAPHHEFSTSFRRELNQDQNGQPNLLQTIDLSTYRPTILAPLAPGLMAAAGADGWVGTVSGFDNRLYAARIGGGDVLGLAVLGSRLYVLDSGGRLARVALGERRTEFAADWPPGRLLASDRHRRLAWVQDDGTIRLWDLESNWTAVFGEIAEEIVLLALDLSGRTISVGRHGSVYYWNPATGKMAQSGLDGGEVEAATADEWGRIALVMKTKGDRELRLLDAGGEKLTTVSSFGLVNQVLGLTLYADGRIFIGSCGVVKQACHTLQVIKPREGRAVIKDLPGHGSATYGCLASGPRLLSWGEEDNGSICLKIWGTEGYVSRERENLCLLEKAASIPPFYHSFF